MRLVGFATPQMANHVGGWAPGALVRFGNLDFIVTTEGGLGQVQVPVWPARTTSLDPVIDAFEGMRLRTSEDSAFGDSWLLDFDFEMLGHQLHDFLGPRPT
jgi:hypothetical protein